MGINGSVLNNDVVSNADSVRRIVPKCFYSCFNEVVCHFLCFFHGYGNDADICAELFAAQCKFFNVKDGNSAERATDDVRIDVKAGNNIKPVARKTGILD